TPGRRTTGSEAVRTRQGKGTVRSMMTSDRSIAVTVGAAACIVYLAAGSGLVTDYDYYGRLAQAFLDGRWWLTEAPPWLNELLDCGDGRWCVAYPPLPDVFPRMLC